MEKIQIKSVIFGRINLRIVFLRLTQLRCAKYLRGSFFVQNDQLQQNTLRNTMQPQVISQQHSEQVVSVPL